MYDTKIFTESFIEKAHMEYAKFLKEKGTTIHITHVNVIESRYSSSIIVTYENVAMV